jgi:diguanylate cyclase (GGDEF)-like protein
MSDPTPPIPAANLLSAATMLHLHDQAQAAREELADLKVEVDRTRRLSRSRERRILRSANERLVCSALLALREADEYREALRHATLSAQFDALTGLPNRALFVDRMTHAIAHARRHGTLLAVLFLDLNNFKQVNDAFGHATGDEVLREAARRLVASLREEDTICRHGGDEFVVLLTQVTEPEDAVGVAHKLIAALDSPCEPDLPAVRLTTSVGVSLFPRDGANAGELVARADLAMYRRSASDWAAPWRKARRASMPRSDPRHTSPSARRMQRTRRRATASLRHPVPRWISAICSCARPTSNSCSPRWDARSCRRRLSSRYCASRSAWRWSHTSCVARCLRSGWPPRC